MNKNVLLPLAFLFAMTLSAYAQQAPSPTEQRISAQIGTLVIQNTALQVKVEQLQAQIEKNKQDQKKAAPTPPKTED